MKKIPYEIYLILTLTIASVWGLSEFAVAQEAPQATQSRVASTAQSTANASSPWKFDLDIYLWGPSIGGQTAPGSDLDVSIKDILPNLNGAFMGEFGVHKDKWSVMLDVVWVDVKDDGSATIPLPMNPIDIDASLELRSAILTPYAAYKVLDRENAQLEILAGARNLDLDTELQFTLELPNPIEGPVEISDSVWDGIVGVKGHINLSRKWYVPYHADIGAGGSKLTGQAFGGIGYRFKWLSLVVAYRYMGWNLDKRDFFGSAFDDLSMGGPLVGVKFQF